VPVLVPVLCQESGIMKGALSADRRFCPWYSVMVPDILFLWGREQGVRALSLVAQGGHRCFFLFDSPEARRPLMAAFAVRISLARVDTRSTANKLKGLRDLGLLDLVACSSSAHCEPTLMGVQ
jgi:hypothetical protein